MLATFLRRRTRDAFEFVGAIAWMGHFFACGAYKAVDDRLQDPEERARRAKNDARVQRLNEEILARWEARDRAREAPRPPVEICERCERPRASLRREANRTPVECSGFFASALCWRNWWDYCQPPEV